jgi:hypothetical protein
MVAAAAISRQSGWATWAAKFPLSSTTCLGQYDFKESLGRGSEDNMNRVIDGVWVAVLSLAIGTGSSAAGAGLASDPIVMAVRHGDCSKAVRELNSEVNANQSQTALFVGGRMS